MSDNGHIDISEHVRGICAAFDLVYENVGRIDITPSKASVEVYKLNEQGSKYIEDSGDAARDVLEFAITT